MTSNGLKTYDDSYLYQQTKYAQNIMQFLISSDVVDKNSEAFADILYEVKSRATSPVLSKVLQSSKVVLCLNHKPMPRAFKVLYAKDIKNKSNDKKVFIDCTDIITSDGGTYRCKNIAILLSYLTTAMTYVIYYNLPSSIIRNNTLTQTSTEAFVDMMLYLFGFMGLPVTYADNKEKMSYILAEYYLYCILCKKDDDMIGVIAKKVSGLDAQKCSFMNTALAPFFEKPEEITIVEFTNKFSEFILHQSNDTDAAHKFTVDALSDLWMKRFGPGTIFGLELFVPFATMLTDCYIGAYLNQQNTIQKVVGTNMTKFVVELFKVGSENA